MDPVGAAFGLVPVVGEEAPVAGPSEHVGRIAGLTLVVADVSSACTFYEQVVGWSPAPSDGAAGCEMRLPAGASAADIRPAGGANGGIPPIWLLGLSVADLAESLRRVRESGGAVINGSAATGHAVIRDPVGVFIALQANR